MATSTREALADSLQRFGLERDRLRANLARRAGMSESELDALEHLEADGPLTQRELGTRLSLTSGAVTMLVDRLEQAGWVRRRPHPDDRRGVLLTLSERAVDDAPSGLVSYHAAIRALVGRVPAGDRATITRFLTAAAEAAADAADDLAP